MIKYKGYVANVKYDVENRVYFGRAARMKDVITFQCVHESEILQAFRDSVDDYLEFCKLAGDEPEKPAKEGELK